MSSTERSISRHMLTSIFFWCCPCSLQSFAYDASQTFADLSNGFLPLAYAFLTATFLGAGFGYLLAPYQTLDIIFGGFATKGPEDVLTWQLVGAGVSILLGSIGYSLKVRCRAALSHRWLKTHMALACCGILH